MEESCCNLKPNNKNGNAAKLACFSYIGYAFLKLREASAGLVHMGLGMAESCCQGSVAQTDSG